jgi:multidrug resistance efflux pump
VTSLSLTEADPAPAAAADAGTHALPQAGDAVEAAGPLPVRRADLVLVPHGDDGESVVKDPVSGAYFHLGPEESFLLQTLDGRHSPVRVREAYERRFGQPLSREELDGFVELADSMGLVSWEHVPPARRIVPPAMEGLGEANRTDESAAPRAAPKDTAAEPLHEQSILYWRKSLFDPDRLFNRVEPKIRFVWTRAFLVVSVLSIIAALGVMLTNRHELISRFVDAMSWQTLLCAWVTLVLATTAHEFAHGLTCKHYGKEVHEVGFLLIFFMPAFFCNVSDAWLLREKSKRVWVTLAGGYCDLLLWAGAVFVWRLTMQDALVNYLAWVVLSVCGVRIFFNFNPLLKLDGYYLLSDLASVPNLRQRAWDALMARVRWALWGAERPAGEPKGRFLFGFGVAVWVYSLSFLVLMFVGLTWWLGRAWGPVGTVAAVALGVTVTRGQFAGACGGEVRKMLKQRWSRVAAWGLAVLAAGAVLTLVPMEQTATGAFKIRSVTHAEMRAPMAGFLREVNGDEGDRVSAGAVVARLDVPDLAPRIAQKKAEIAESGAKLRLLQFGPRGPLADGVAEPVIRSAEADAEKARLAKLAEELRYLEDQSARVLVRAGAAGVICTPRLREKVGQYFNDGDLICLIEEPAKLEAQVDVPEQEAARVRRGQRVALKARSLPFEQLEASVDRVAPAADAPDPKDGKLQSTVPVYCTLTAASPAALRPGMTGFARISCGKRAMGRVLSEKFLAYFRTEFWW